MTNISEGTPVVDITAGVAAMRADATRTRTIALTIRWAADEMERQADRLDMLADTFDPPT